MSRVVAIPPRRTPSRPAVLDLVARTDATAEQPLGPEEAEFLEALRRLVARTPAQELWDKYRGSSADGPARIFARYAD
jgi:hypothetical protein